MKWSRAGVVVESKVTKSDRRRFDGGKAVGVLPVEASGDWYVGPKPANSSRDLRRPCCANPRDRVDERESGVLLISLATECERLPRVLGDTCGYAAFGVTKGLAILGWAAPKGKPGLPMVAELTHGDMADGLGADTPC